MSSSFSNGPLNALRQQVCSCNCHLPITHLDECVFFHLSWMSSTLSSPVTCYIERNKEFTPETGEPFSPLSWFFFPSSPSCNFLLLLFSSPLLLIGICRGWLIIGQLRSESNDQILCPKFTIEVLPLSSLSSLSPFLPPPRVPLMLHPRSCSDPPLALFSLTHAPNKWPVIIDSSLPLSLILLMPGVRQVNFNTHILSNVNVYMCVCVCCVCVHLRFVGKQSQGSLFMKSIHVCVHLAAHTLWVEKSSAALFSLSLSLSLFALLCPFWWMVNATSGIFPLSISIFLTFQTLTLTCIPARITSGKQ